MPVAEGRTFSQPVSGHQGSGVRAQLGSSRTARRLMRLEQTERISQGSQRGRQGRPRTFSQKVVRSLAFSLSANGGFRRAQGSV